MAFLAGVALGFFILSFFALCRIMKALEGIEESLDLWRKQK